MKVSFFFGAGAEGKGNFGLPMGEDFMKKTLFSAEDNKSLLEGLDGFFNVENERGDSFKVTKDSFNNDSFYLELLRNWLSIQKEKNTTFYIKYKKNDKVRIIV